jgi:osmotically-inducible protein OsmY
MTTDAQVLHQVLAAFELSPRLRTSPLRIDVKTRIVTVTGLVNSDAERKEVEVTLRGFVGVRALVLKVGIVPRSTVCTV